MSLFLTFLNDYLKVLIAKMPAKVAKLWLSWLLGKHQRKEDAMLSCPRSQDKYSFNKCFKDFAKYNEMNCTYINVGDYVKASEIVFLTFS